MKLFLTSAGLQNKAVANYFISILSKTPNDVSVLMITYAQNENEQFYVDESRRELVDLGIKNIFTFNLKEDAFGVSRDFDVIYVCGGNTFAILNRMRIVGVDGFIKSAAESGRSIYFGVSAGSIIAGPSIEIAGWGSEGDKNEVSLQDLTGFGLTDIAVSPHFTPSQKDEVEEFKKAVGYSVVELTNDEAVFVDDHGYKIIR